MTPELIVYAALAGLFGGFINGFAGTGTALFGLGFLLVALPPPQAVLVIALVSVLAGLQGVWVVRHVIPRVRGRILLLVLPGLVGIPLGVVSLQFVGPEALRLLVGAFLVVYGGYFGLRRSLPHLPAEMPTRDGLVGLVSGFLGGLASLSGALPAIWLSMRDWPKEETRAVMQSFNVAILGTTAATLVARGAFTSQTAAALAVALPVGVMSAQAGIWMFRRLSDLQFRRALILLCLMMGLGIIGSALF